MESGKKLVLTVDEMAGRLGAHRDTILDMIHAGAFRARLVGRAWKIPSSSLEEFLAGRDNPLKALSVEEVAEALGVHRNTISAMLHDGSIRAVKVGRTWKVPVAALEEFLSGRDNPEGGNPQSQS